MKKVSNSDKRALILLAVFLIGAAGYFYVFQPMNTEHKKLSGMLQEKNKDVMNRQRMISERSSWQQDAEKLLKEAAEVIKEIQVRSYSMTTEDILENLTDKAEKAGCTVESIRPVKVVSEDGGDLPENYLISGKGYVSYILDYISSVDGLSLSEFSLSGAHTDKPANFYLRFSEITAGNIDKVTSILTDAGIDVRPETVKPVIKAKPAEKTEVHREISAVKAAEPQKAASALMLEGVTTLGAVKYALLSDGSETGYIAEGGSMAGYTVSSVTDEQVVLLNADGEETTLKFDDAVDGEMSVSGVAEMTADADSPAPVSEAKNGHLGIKAVTGTYKGKKVLKVVSAGLQSGVLKEGDLIISINGTALDGDETVKEAMKDVKAGENVPLVVLHDGSETGVYIKATE